MYMRLMDEAEDFRFLGINPKRVEEWENARRSPRTGGAWEAWSVEMWDGEGTRLSVRFSTKDPARVDSGADTPRVRVSLALPGEGTVTAAAHVDPADCAYGDGGPVHMGDSEIAGGYASCDVHAEPDEGSPIDAATVHLEALCRPLRPGAGVFDLGRDGKVAAGWVSAMPCATATGSVTVGGEERALSGWARQTHAWGTLPPQEAIHHALLSTMRFDDGVLTLLDVTACRKAGYMRYPMAFLANRRGVTVLASTVDKRCACDARGEAPMGGLTRPESVAYTFTEPGDVALSCRLEGLEEAGDAGSAVFGSRRLGARKRVMTLAPFSSKAVMTLREPAGGRMALVPDVSDRKGGEARLASQGGAGSLDDIVDTATSRREGEAAVTLVSAPGPWRVEHSEQVTTEYVL